MSGDRDDTVVDFIDREECGSSGAQRRGRGAQEREGRRGARRLRQVEDPIETVCRRLGVARSTFYRWKARFAADVDMEQWLTVQNRRLRESVRKLAGDKALLQFLLRRGD